MTDRFKEALDSMRTRSCSHELKSKWFSKYEETIRRALTLAQEAEQLRYDLQFVWKCVERAKWQPNIFGKPETAIDNMALYPNAPWNNKDAWDWDTSHKDYDEDIKKYVAGNAQLRKERDELAQLVLKAQKENNINAACDAVKLAKKVRDENATSEASDKS